MDKDTQKKLETLTKLVATLASAQAAAQAVVNEAAAAYQAARDALPADPSDANRAKVKATAAALEKARATLADAEAKHRAAAVENDLESARVIRAAQTAAARQTRIEKLARTSPEVGELYEEAKASKLGLESLREKLAARDARIEELEARNAELEKQLASALAPKK